MPAAVPPPRALLHLVGWLRRPWRRRLLGAVAACGTAGWCASRVADRRAIRGELPLDPRLRAAPVRYFRARDRGGRPVAPRAVLFFFGNDVGFWRPHRRLATALTDAGYAVAGLDIRPTLAALPDGGPARDSAFARRVRVLVGQSYAELSLGRRDTPLVLVGHSLGAELAIWVAAHAPPAPTVGVVALSPGLRSHLRVSAADLLMTGEPTEPGSYSVPDAVAAALGNTPWLRVAVVRGSHDRLRYADPALLAAGRGGLRRFEVPFAGHSLAARGLSGYVVRQALAWVLRTDEGPPAVPARLAARVRATRPLVRRAA